MRFWESSWKGHKDFSLIKHPIFDSDNCLKHLIAVWLGWGHNTFGVATSKLLIGCRTVIQAAGVRVPAWIFNFSHCLTLYFYFHTLVGCRHWKLLKRNFVSFTRNKKKQFESNWLVPLCYNHGHSVHTSHSINLWNEIRLGYLECLLRIVRATRHCTSPGFYL